MLDYSKTILNYSKTMLNMCKADVRFHLYPLHLL
ncbi:hypothetical protein PEC331060_08750 [Pectobacterium carotovorum subsp. carotovorum]|nr:hypothetical protein PEC106568_11530 [Pectobacterium carotovorum subsp. carotovorum]GKV97571.1 hypothetical protein PEC301653_06170 [Pectobacterium carotovorum subsp. carotovorum]GKW27697.1 hypothetical protein PEC331060_08750 [Pectobacterium carotovorum subsp. carotovorum]